MTTILIVDDNDQNLYQLQVLLGGNGYRVVTATNGTEALTQARQNPPDLIVSDILMPVMDGFTLCRAWKQDERLRSVPFIFYTATYTDERDRTLALSLGAERFFVKPEDPEVFVQAIRDVLTHALRSPVTPPAASPDEEAGFLKQYSETLIRKLETKMQQLERANLELQQSLTEGRRKSESLRESEQRYDTFVNALPDMAYLKDEAFRHIVANTALLNFFGKSRDEVIGKTDFDLLPNASAQNCRDSDLKALQSDDVIRVVESVNGRDYEIWKFRVRLANGVWGVGGFLRDVTEHKRIETALADEVIRRRILIEESSDGIVVIDHEGNVFEANRRYAEMLGYTSQEVLKLHVWDWESQATREQVLEMIGQADSTGAHFETRHRRKDGTFLDVEISTNGALCGGQKLVFCVCRDITARKAHEREIERLTRLYVTLSQINQAIIRVRSREELLREICRVTADFGGFKVVWIGVSDPKTRRVIPVARGGKDDGYLDAITVYADTQPEGCGPVGTCIREGKPCIVNDFLNSPKALPWRESARAHGIRAAAAMPICFKGEVWGAFTVYDGEADVFQDREVALLEEAASDISYAMDNLQQEARYRTILQAAMDGFWRVDTQGRLLEVNTAYCRMSGYSEQELLSMRIPALENGETADDIAAHIQKIMAQSEHRFESRHRRKDGSTFDVEISAQYQPEDGGQLVVFLQDITERKRSEEALQESERRLAEAQNMAQLGHWMWDVKTGRVEWSDQVYKIFRLDPATFTPRIDSILAFSPWPDECERDKELIRKAVESHEKGNYEQKILRQDKSIGFYQSTFQGKYDAQGELVSIVGTVLDITERKQTEEYRTMGLNILHILNEPANIRDSLSRVLKELKERTGFDAVGIRQQDGEDFPYFTQVGFPEDFLLKENTLASRGADGGICRDKDGNACLECTCGLVISGKTDPTHPLFTRGGSFWTNDSFQLLDLPPDLDPRFHPRNECIHHGYASVALIPIRNKQSIVGLIQLNDHRKGCFTLAMVELLEGIASHIGEALMRKRTEDALRMSEEKHRAIINASPVPMALNDAQQHIIFVNPAFVQTFGYTLEDIPTLADWWPKAYPDPTYRLRVASLWQTRIEQTRLTGAALPPIEVTVRCKDGSDKTVLASATSLLDAFSDTYLVILYDNTNQKRAEEERLKMQKLQSIGTLAGGIAHDFNNILLGVFGNIALAKSELSEKHPGYAFLEESEKSMTRAVRLTKQLLTFAKGGEPVKEAVCLGEMVEEVAQFDLSGSSVSLVYRQSPDLWQVEADKGQIEQVVSNLVINARQAMPNGGHLYISLENASVQEASIPGLRQGKYIKVSVRDEGTGIAPKVLDQIFDPYFTTKQSGNGLGLATVWSIVTKHGGHISVVSELGKGTTFTFHLPASAQPAETKLEPEAEGQAPAPARPARILVMDDDESVCRLVVRILSPCGYSIATTHNAQKVTALYKQALEAGTPYDVVIMDLTIPGGIGGKEVIKDLLALDPRVHAIVSSGYADNPVMANPSAYGFKGTVAKPYTISELRAVVARVLK